MCVSVWYGVGGLALLTTGCPNALCFCKNLCALSAWLCCAAVLWSSASPRRSVQAGPAPTVLPPPPLTHQFLSLIQRLSEMYIVLAGHTLPLLPHRQLRSRHHGNRKPLNFPLLRIQP